KRAKDFQCLFTNHKIPYIPKHHVMYCLFCFAETIGVARPDDDQLRWDIPLSDADLAFAEQHAGDGKTLVISPCSSQRARNFRNWSEENYIAVSQYSQQELGMKVIVTGGPSDLEKHYGKAISDATGAESLVGKTSLKELCALLQKATVLISPDSGPAHMANAMKTPVIGLYATSNPCRTGPYLSNDQWVVNAYPEACQTFKEKTVEEMKWGGRVRAPEAMSLISVDQVNSKLLKLQ
ncbi:MAG: glycosyltransferase family 9 protein, partial [Gammaproteobacteria bacterium]|nr:glycosyltransferase family 9 protein [Gammaproteobacteria bacterium]